MMDRSQPASSMNGKAAVAEGYRFFVLPGWMNLALTGSDRQQFLHNFCTNDVKGLASGANCEAFFCNVKGRVLAHGLITCRDDDLGIIGPPGQAASLAAHLDRYVIREDVFLCDLTLERAYVLVFGGDAGKKIAKTAGVVLPRAASAQMRWTNAPAQLDGVNVRWIQWPLAGLHSVVIETSPSDLPRVEQWLKELGVRQCEHGAFEAARIEAGTPLFGVDFDDHNFPQEIGRDEQAISFTKGCYLGQETVARIDALGHVNQRLVGVRFFEEELPAAGAELTHDAKNVGRVTSAAFSPNLQAPLALAMVRREHTAVGNRLDSPVGACEVIALPLQ